MSANFVFSTHNQYAIACMVIFARYGAELTVAELMKRLGVSRPYTTDFVGALERAGLLLKGEGFRAGYRLGREAAAITLLEIVRAEKDSWYYRKQVEREASLPEFAEAKMWGVFAEDWLGSVTLDRVAGLDGDGRTRLSSCSDGWFEGRGI